MYASTNSAFCVGGFGSDSEGELVRSCAAKRPGWRGVTHVTRWGTISCGPHHTTNHTTPHHTTRQTYMVHTEGAGAGSLTRDCW